MESCAVCGVPALQKCSSCNAKYYCSKEHQKVDWRKVHKSECKCFEVASNEVLGRYMIAKRDIRVGEVILREAPCVIGPKITSYVMCLGCHKLISPPTDGDYKKCSKCSWPMCGEGCENLPSHVDECRAMSEKNFKCSIRNTGQSKTEASYCVIVPLRLILLKKSNPEAHKAVMELVSHLDQRMETKLYETLRANLVPFIREFLKIRDYSETEILNIAGILDTNCFDIVLPSKQIRARGIYPLTAMMAHDCVPNTKHFVDGDFTMKVIACLPIKKGDLISTSYTHPLKTTLERRYQLKLAKCFDCLCSRCKDPTEMKTFASAIRCRHCVDGILIPMNSLSSSSDWQCNACSLELSVDQVISVLSRARKSLDSLNKKSIDACEKFLTDFEGILPSRSVFIIDVKYALSLLYGNVSGFTIEVLSSSQLARKLELCQEMVEALDVLERGISNSATNVKFELCFAKIAQFKQQRLMNLLSCEDVKTRIAAELIEAKIAYEILVQGSEGHALLESRLKRVIDFSS